MGFQKMGELLNDRVNDKFNGNVIELSNKKVFNDKSMKTNEINESKAGYTEYVADKLVKIYNAPMSRNFFLKCAWHLSENKIWTTVENSRRKGIKSPIKYFIAVCNRALRERPIE